MADSALYTKESLNKLEWVNWVTRVAETIGEAKEQILVLDRDQMTEWGNGYSIKEMESN